MRVLLATAFLLGGCPSAAIDGPDARSDAGSSGARDAGTTDASTDAGRAPVAVRFGSFSPALGSSRGDGHVLSGRIPASGSGGTAEGPEHVLSGRVRISP